MQGIWTVTQGLPAPLGRELRLGSVDASVSVCFFCRFGRTLAIRPRCRVAVDGNSRRYRFAQFANRMCLRYRRQRTSMSCPHGSTATKAPGAAMRAFPSISRGAQPCGLGGCAPKPRLSKPSAQARRERPAFRASRLNRVESGRAELTRSRLSANTGPRARTGQGRFSPAPRRRHAGRAARTCGPRRPVTGQSSPSARAVERKRDPVHTIRESGEGLSSTPLRLRDANRDSLGPNNQGATVSARPAYKILVIARRQLRIAACGQTPPRKCGSCVAGMTHAPPRGYPNAAHAYRRGADGPGQGAAEKKRRHAPETGFRACVSPARSIRFMHDCVLVVFMTVPLWLVARRSSRHTATRMRARLCRRLCSSHPFRVAMAVFMQWRAETMVADIEGYSLTWPPRSQDNTSSRHPSSDGGATTRPSRSTEREPNAWGHAAMLASRPLLSPPDVAAACPSSTKTGATSALSLGARPNRRPSPMRLRETSRLGIRQS